MQNQLETRLRALRDEYAKGEKMLADTEREADDLRATLLRIGGAIQVLEELQEEENASDED
ncbi:MAG: hypothetical protein AAGD04_13405 [Pseudomonadota bacterium]